MARRAFLLEIGCEEIPAAMIRPAGADLGEGLLSALGRLGEGAKVVLEYGGPRRIACLIEGVGEREEDRRETVLGPPAATAFSADGAPTRAAEGFARKLGIDVADLRVEASPRGDVVAGSRFIPGRSASRLLAEACPRVIAGLRFGKMMRWGECGHTFVRPVHWILALLDDEIIPFEFAGVASGRTTRGHRFLGPGPHEIPRAGDYDRTLREKGGVVARHEERRRLLAEGAAAAAAEAGGRLREDADLMEELVFLTEHPAVLWGSFSVEFLQLPEAVLMTTMRHHQKYLTVERPDGRLHNAFVAVLNTDPDAEGRIRRGNEWVLRARLADARFFYDEDQIRPLIDRAADLSKITFHARLGSYQDKFTRMQRLIAPEGGLLEATGAAGAGGQADLELALRICKADLTTGMVGEFPELQGVIGGIYARVQGHPERAARAVEEHYLPASASGPLPSRGVASALALADKFDTLAVCFKAGFIPKGSADPYGLRRAAMGAVRILIENEMRLSLPRVLDLALAAAETATAPLRKAAEEKEKAGKARPAIEPRDALHEFFKLRIQHLMEESGVRFDAARAALSSGWDDPLLAWRRARAVEDLRGEADFLALAAAAKRVRNILGQASAKGMEVGAGDLSPSRLSSGAERGLHDAMGTAAAEAERLAGREDHRGALSRIASLRPAVDRFFDDVLVMDPDEEVRRNRIALLARLANLLSREADFAEIVVEGESAS